MKNVPLISKLKTAVTASAIIAALSFSGAPADANPLKDLNKSLKKLERTLKKQKIETVIGGAVGAVVGTKILKNNKLVGAVIGSAVGAFVGNEISKSLDKRQKDQMANATVTSVVSGEDSNWESADKKTKGRVTVASTEQRQQPVAVKVAKAKVKDVPPLDFIGETFDVLKTSNVRGGPSTDYEKVGRLVAGSQINVVGKVIGEPWYFISENGVANGFIYEPLVRQAASSIVGAPQEDAATDTADEEDDTFEVTVADQLLCRTVEQAVTLDDGTEKTETLTACKGANGWEIQPNTDAVQS